jgi:hypothetical protein
MARRTDPVGPSQGRDLVQSLFHVLQRRADDVHLVTDLAPHEEESHDRDNSDKSKDECVFSETLAILFGSDPVEDRYEQLGRVHSNFTSFPARLGGCRIGRRFVAIVENKLEGEAVNSPFEPSVTIPLASARRQSRRALRLRRL